MNIQKIHERPIVLVFSVCIGAGLWFHSFRDTPAQAQDRSLKKEMSIVQRKVKKLERVLATYKKEISRHKHWIREQRINFQKAHKNSRSRTEKWKKMFRELYVKIQAEQAKRVKLDRQSVLENQVLKKRIQKAESTIQSNAKLLVQHTQAMRWVRVRHAQASVRRKIVMKHNLHMRSRLIFDYQGQISANEDIHITPKGMHRKVWIRRSHLRGGHLQIDGDLQARKNIWGPSVVVRPKKVWREPRANVDCPNGSFVRGIRLFFSKKALGSSQNKRSGIQKIELKCSRL